MLLIFKYFGNRFIFSLLVVPPLNLRRALSMAYVCGQKPGIGLYVCLNCGEDLYLDDKTDTLPPCTKCNKCQFKRG